MWKYCILLLWQIGHHNRLEGQVRIWILSPPSFVQHRESWAEITPSPLSPCSIPCPGEVYAHKLHIQAPSTLPSPILSHNIPSATSQVQGCTHQHCGPPGGWTQERVLSRPGKRTRASYPESSGVLGFEAWSIQPSVLCWWNCSEMSVLISTVATCSY